MKYCTSILRVKPAVTFGQVNAWWNTFDFIERLKNNYADTKFWHSWHFDWRGRIMPISTMLSPQNDDFARGLITFANPEPLTDSGRMWMGRVIAVCIKDSQSQAISRKTKKN